MKIEFCSCKDCRSMFKHGLVRRSLENEFPVMLADRYNDESKHFICAKWYNFGNETGIIRLGIKGKYRNAVNWINHWSDNQ